MLRGFFEGVSELDFSSKGLYGVLQGVYVVWDLLV